MNGNRARGCTYHYFIINLIELFNIFVYVKESLLKSVSKKNIPEKIFDHQNSKFYIGQNCGKMFTAQITHAKAKQKKKLP